jgi:iron complex transport system substrate-binding protein
LNASTIDVRRRRLVAAALAAPLASRPLTEARAQAQATRLIVDSANRKVAIPARVERIYAAGPPASILVFAVAPDKLLGWTTPWREAEKPYIARRYLELPVLGRLTGRGNTANVEVLLAHRPDVIVDYGAIRPTYISLADRVQEQTGIPYLLLDGAFDRIAPSMELIASVTGDPRAADPLVRFTRETLAAVSRRIESIPAEKRPRVYYARGPNGLTTGLSGSINVEILERVGAHNVAAELGRGGLVQVSFEQVLRWDPDVIVTIDPGFYGEARRNPLWRTLRAVTSGEIYLSPNVPYGWIDFPPSVNRLIGLRWLAHVLYPAAFSEDLRPIVREFYELFYHQRPSEQQLNELLGNAERPRR